MVVTSKVQAQVQRSIILLNLMAINIMETVPICMVAG